MPRFELSAAELLGSNAPERVKKCRQFAAEASGSAAHARNSGTEKAYLDLEREWNRLADEIEKIENGRLQLGAR